MWMPSTNTKTSPLNLMFFQQIVVVALSNSTGFAVKGFAVVPLLPQNVGMDVF
jgi:hypothetical protein